jgi:preprotein translocase subunit SecA
MIVPRLRRQVLDAGLLPTATPYVEKIDRQEGLIDSALLYAWGRISPYALMRLQRSRLDRFVRRVERQESRLLSVPDRRLREIADALREKLLTAPFDSDELALAFALAREAAHRHVGMRHFRVQLLGGAAMMRGALAEMQTGEGKTLTALLPAIAAALMRRPVHIVTVNDYLARRDAEQLRPVYHALGLTVGLVQHEQGPQERQQAYSCDVTYCTNKEIVFDYLRDRLALGLRRARTRLLIEALFQTSQPGRAQRLLLRGLHFAIVDEADSVLIDEARTPLILSGLQEGGENEVALYETALDIARQLHLGRDFHVLANERTARLTPRGEWRASQLVTGLPRLWAVDRAREELVQQALSALHLFRRDVQYIVTNGKVQIVDEYTGRVMPDRSWERGLHQLVEVKENCPVTARHQTLARITYQRFFRRYQHLCGMTGTAMEAAGELRAVYGLQVVRIPTNRPLRRTNAGTRNLPTAKAKWEAVINSAKTAMNAGRAVLIGTRSVAASEHIGQLLRNAGLHPVVLNARQDRQEADIVAGAGQPRWITVATNMAGRGTDIRLHPVVKDAAGLHVILTEYHESARIDRQLFGRAGRQGDPGSYESIVSIDDELFRHFAAKQVLALISQGGAGTKDIPPIIGRMLKRMCQSAAERLHARTRRAALAEDQRFNKILGFAGAE